jgi:hypothetical protein
MRAVDMSQISKDRSSRVRIAAQPRRLAACIAWAISCALASAGANTPATARDLARDALQPSAILVDNCADAGAGSLREAMATAADGQLVDASGLTCGVITLTTGQIEISAASVTLLGPGRDVLTLQNGNGAKYTNRIFAHSGAGQLALQGMTLAGGTMSGSASSLQAYGGCVYSAGSVVLGNPLQTGVRSLGVNVVGCRAVASAADEGGRAAGGGVFARQLTLINSTVSGCEATSHTPSVTQAGPDGGGGVFAKSALTMYASELADNDVSGSHYGGGGGVVDGPALIINSLIAGNHDVDVVGGLYANGPNTIRNSTFSGNVGGAVGGVLTSQFDHTVVSNSTFTDNHAAATGVVGGAALLGETIELESTIIAGNSAGDGPADVWGVNGIAGANDLVGVAVADTPSLPPGTLIGLDPLLGPLTNNGGPTRTHALLAASPAIDTGNNVAGEETDQRGVGFPRLIGAGADIGAVESSDAIFSDGFEFD